MPRMHRPYQHIVQERDAKQTRHGIHRRVVQERRGINGASRTDRHQLRDRHRLRVDERRELLYARSERFLEDRRAHRRCEIIDGIVRGSLPEVGEARGSSDTGNAPRCQQAAMNAADILGPKHISEVAARRNSCSEPLCLTSQLSRYGFW